MVREVHTGKHDKLWNAQFRKRREIKNGDQYISSAISLDLDCLENSEFTSSESRDYIGISGKGMTTYMTIRTKITNKKQKARFAITDIINQYFIKLLK